MSHISLIVNTLQSVNCEIDVWTQRIQFRHCSRLRTLTSTAFGSGSSARRTRSCPDSALPRRSKIFEDFPTPDAVRAGPKCVSRAVCRALEPNAV